MLITKLLTLDLVDSADLDNEDEGCSLNQYEDDSEISDLEFREAFISRDKLRFGDDYFLDLDAEETAKQLTLIDSQLFRYVFFFSKQLECSH